MCSYITFVIYQLVYIFNISQLVHYIVPQLHILRTKYESNNQLKLLFLKDMVLSEVFVMNDSFFGSFGPYVINWTAAGLMSYVNRVVL